MDKHNACSNPSGSPYYHAFGLACESLRCADIEERAGKSGAYFEKREDGHCLIRLTFLNRSCLVHFPEIAVSYEDEREDVPLWSKIIILHYFIQSQGLPLTGEWISFRQLSGGEIYYPAFEKRSEKPLLDFFTHRVDLFEQAGLALGGTRIPAGDRGVVVTALPRVPLALVFWKGDEEFPPETRILFDSSVTAYLSTEDVAVLAQQTVFQLIYRAQNITHNKS